MVDELDNMTWWLQQIRDGSYSTAPLDSRDLLVRDYTDVVTQLRNEVLSLLIYTCYFKGVFPLPCLIQGCGLDPRSRPHIFIVGTRNKWSRPYISDVVPILDGNYLMQVVSILGTWYQIAQWEHDWKWAQPAYSSMLILTSGYVGSIFHWKKSGFDLGLSYQWEWDLMYGRSQVWMQDRAHILQQEHTLIILPYKNAVYDFVKHNRYFH